MTFCSAFECSYAFPCFSWFMFKVYLAVSSCSHGNFPVIVVRGFWYFKRRRFEGTSLRNSLFTEIFGSGVTCADFAKMTGVSRWISHLKIRSATQNFLSQK